MPKKLGFFDVLYQYDKKAGFLRLVMRDYGYQESSSNWKGGCSLAGGCGERRFDSFTFHHEKREKMKTFVRIDINERIGEGDWGLHAGVCVV